MTPEQAALREQAVAALQLNIRRGLEKGELDLPRLRLDDYGWLARNAYINNKNTRGAAVSYLANVIWWEIDLQNA